MMLKAGIRMSVLSPMPFLAWGFLFCERRNTTMPVGKRKGPLPDGHPLKGGLIIVGMKKPVPLERQSTEGQPAKEEMQSDTTNTNTDQ